MSSYLITGGAGFIGSHLVDYLINQGHQVLVIDDLSSGAKDNLNKNCKFIKGSATDPNLLASAMEGIDFCYHLAAISSVQRSIEEWTLSHSVNLQGTINVFLEAAKRNIPVIYASSAAVYGNPDALPIKENGLIKPLSPYGLDKYCSELQAKLFANIHGLKNLGLRFFNVYGSRQDPASPYSGVISIFINKITNEKPLNVYGDGTQERDFVFISDIINVLIKAQDFVSLESKVYNVCTGVGLSINNLIRILFETFGRTVPVNYLPAKNGDIYKSIGDNRKITNEMGYLVEKKVSPDLLLSILK